MSQTEYAARELWQVAADMGVSVDELRQELEVERAIMLGAETVEGSGSRVPTEIGQVLERAPFGPQRAPAAIALHSAPAIAGREVLASLGHRTDVVVTINGGSMTVNRAVATGTATSAARRCEQAQDAIRDAKSAKRAALAGMHVATPQRRAEVARLATEEVEAATARFELACAQHAVAALWADVPECKPEITVPVEVEYFATHSAPVDRMPITYADRVRVHPDRAPSDKTGNEACSNVMDVLAEQDRRERALIARVSAAAVAAATDADRSATNAAYKARRAAAARERRARNH